MPRPLPHSGVVDEATPLHAVAFTVVDLETTGGSPTTCAITEVGAVRVCGGQRERELTTLVHPGVAIPRSITALTGISDQLVATAPPITAVLPMLLEVLHGSVLVAHSARFDVSFLNAALARYDYPALDLPVVCTATLARRLVRDEVRNCRLATLSAHFRTAVSPTHRALADARATVEVLHALLERAAGVGVTTLGGLLELCRRRDLSTVEQRHRLADRLPSTPGVYAFRSASGEVLYVGKAVDLRARVRTYFGSDPRRMVRRLVRETARIDHRACGTEIEAQVREVRAIGRWRPRYNRRDKPPPRATWLKLTVERFPRLSIVRTVRDDGATYLGPLRSRRQAEQIREALHDAFPIRRCTLRIGPRTRAPACALAEMGRCDAPCTGDVDPTVYDIVVRQVRAALRDGSGTAVPRLLAQITARSDALRYQEAGWRRDRLAALTAAVVRRRAVDALAGVTLTAWQPIGGDGADVVRVVDGRFAASARTTRGDVTRAVDGLPDVIDVRVDDPFVVDAERLLLERWLTATGTRVLDIDGEWAEPVAGGATLASAWRRLRRRRDARSARAVADKRLRRDGAASTRTLQERALSTGVADERARRVGGVDDAAQRVEIDPR